MILFLQFLGGRTRGGERYTARLHAFLKRAFDIVEPGELPENPPEMASIVGHARESLRLVKTRCPALIVTDVSSGARNILAARLAKKHGAKLLLIIQERRTSYRINAVGAKWLIHRCENYLIGLADIILVNSQYIASYSARRAGKRAKIIVCHPGLEFTEIAPDTGLKHSGGPTINLLAVGDYSEPRKGIRYLLEALPQLSRLDLRLHLAGGCSEDPSHLEVIKAIIERNNLKDRVIFHGYLDRQSLSALYDQSDIFVLPSLSEGYGMVLAEALQFGLPIVASNVAAIPEMVTDGANALLVKPKSSQALATAVQKLATDLPLRNCMRQINLARAATLPTWSDFDSTLGQQLVPVIENLTGLKAKQGF